jgi:hypothetical protein
VKQNVRLIGGDFCFTDARRHTGIGRIPQDRKPGNSRIQRAKYFETFGAQLWRHQGITGYISARPCETRDETDTDGITDGSEHDRDRIGGLFGCKASRRPDRHYDIYILPDQICGESLQPLDVTFRELALDDDVLTLQITEFRELPREGRDKKSASACIKQAYPEQLLGACSERPNDCHAAEKRDEVSSMCDVTH